MALGSTGAMRMGADVNVELGSSSTTQISLGQASVRTLTGVASGAVRFPTNFYGKSYATGLSTALFYGGYNSGGFQSILTRINDCGALVGSETNLSSGLSAYHAGASFNGNGVYVGGTNGNNAFTNNFLKVNKCGTLLSQTGYTDISIYNAGGVANTRFIAQQFCDYTSQRTASWNSCGTKIGQSSVTVTNRPASMCAVSGSATQIGSNAVFYGGIYCCDDCSGWEGVYRINDCRSLVGSAVFTGYLTGFNSAATLADNKNFGFFYGGYYAPGIVKKMNACGAIVADKSVLVNQAKGPGAGTQGVGFIYGGIYNCSIIYTNNLQRINICANKVGSTTSVGTGRIFFAGASA